MDITRSEADLIINALEKYLDLMPNGIEANEAVALLKKLHLTYEY